MTQYQSFLSFSQEVLDARAAGKAIVALESTIISHGMPYPQNVAMAREVEQIIRDGGAVPATIAIIGGKICIGLSDEQLELLGTSPDAMKVSRRDLPFVLSQGKLGATTVAATMICAELASIEVFVTGGLGGVHRGAETSFDISADLQELAQTSVAVVCAGVKSILDIGLTLEYLETHGVPVLSVEATNWSLGKHDGYQQVTKSRAFPDGYAWHDPKLDSLAHLDKALPGRIEKRSRDVVNVLLPLITGLATAELQPEDTPIKGDRIPIGTVHPSPEQAARK